jgi:hypothetical protein
MTCLFGEAAFGAYALRQHIDESERGEPWQLYD